MSFNVLVADASQPMRKLLCRFLEAAGVSRPVESDGATEALEAFQRGKFQLVLTDLLMSGQGGMELIRAIRSRDPDVPIIVMSTEMDPGTVEEAMNAGATEFLRKPFGEEARRCLLEHCRLGPRPES